MTEFTPEELNTILNEIWDTGGDTRLVAMSGKTAIHYGYNGAALCPDCVYMFSLMESPSRVSECPVHLVE